MTASRTRRARLFRALAALVVAGGGLSASGLKYDLPQGWTSTTPKSSMRVAELSLPRAAGDSEDAELVVYYFGGQGPQKTVARWAQAFETFISSLKYEG